MKNRRPIICLIIVAFIILAATTVLGILSRSILMDNEDYYGYLYDSNGNVISENASLILDGKVKRAMPILHSIDTFEGNISIDDGTIKHQLENLKLALTKSGHGSYLLGVIEAYIYEQAAITDTEISVEHEDVGVICWDSVQPDIMMVGLGDEYCEKYQIEKGAVIMVSRQRKTAEELWKKRADYRVDYLDSY